MCFLPHVACLQSRAAFFAGQRIQPRPGIGRVEITPARMSANKARRGGGAAGCSLGTHRFPTHANCRFASARGIKGRGAGRPWALMVSSQRRNLGYTSKIRFTTQVASNAPYRHSDLPVIAQRLQSGNSPAFDSTGGSSLKQCEARLQRMGSCKTCLNR